MAKSDVIAAFRTDFSLILVGWGGTGEGWPRIKRSLQSHGGGGASTVQDVEEHNLHQFYHQI